MSDFYPPAYTEIKAMHTPCGVIRIYLRMRIPKNKTKDGYSLNPFDGNSLLVT